MTPSVSEASISRVEQAEADFAAAAEGINDQTPLSEAAEQFNSAAVALEMAWLQLFFESGCLDDDQQEQANQKLPIVLQVGQGMPGDITQQVIFIAGAGCLDVLAQRPPLPRRKRMEPIWFGFGCRYAHCAIRFVS